MKMRLKRTKNSCVVQKLEKVTFSIGLSSEGDLLLHYSYCWYKHAVGIFHLMLSNGQVH